MADFSNLRSKPATEFHYAKRHETKTQQFRVQRLRGAPRHAPACISTVQVFPRKQTSSRFEIQARRTAQSITVKHADHCARSSIIEIIRGCALKPQNY